ncbi:hypothetical protein [Comamonas sp.]|uniref:hypothetical protein n=1 Tax=Comamonas sp. TaxID=34028 RepID=UPI00289A0931|nr:hypothetical protein [Comamonas sp.]
MLIDSYRVNPKHRANKPSPNASIWQVPAWREIELFALSQRDSICMKTQTSWGCDINNIIGIDLHNNLYFAKFVVDQKVWHGYPVHPRDSDIPPDHVLDAWLKAGVLSKSQRSKISEGKFKK